MTDRQRRQRERNARERDRRRRRNRSREPRSPRPRKDTDVALGDTIRSAGWGNKPFHVTQEFGTYNPDTAHMYPGEYTEPLGYPAGTHVGLDIGMPRGTPLYAISRGTVLQGGPAINEFFRPKPVWIETADNPDTPEDERGFIEIWGHMWENTVQIGDTVVPGQPLGISGEQTHKGTMNPDGSGAHLHFELRMPVADGQYKAVNPAHWLTTGGAGGTQESPEGEDPTDEETPEPGTGALLAGIAAYAQRGILVLVGILVLGVGSWFILR